MFEYASRILKPSIYSEPQSSYPLQRRFLLYGLIAGLIATVLFSSVLAGFSFLTLFGVVGAVWRRDEPPALAFCFAFQWLGVTTGYLNQLITGYYPGQSSTGDIELAVFLSLLGFIALAAGIRTGVFLMRRPVSRVEERLKAVPQRYDLRLLFWVVIAIFAINWFIELDPMGIYFNAAQIIYRIIEFRLVLLFLLFLSILKKRSGYQYGLAAIAFLVIPSFASTMSAFSGVFMLLLVALMTEWRPYSESPLERRRSARMMKWIAVNAAALLIMAVVWQGGIKPTWRPAVTSGRVQGSPIEKVSAFLGIATAGISNLDWNLAADSLGGRVSSGVFYFSHVLNRVPTVVPHEDGALTMRALRLTVTPRFLFPEKENMGSDSWLIKQYAGLYVAGEESETSVGLGYMPEFYIDFGVPGMFVPLFVFGLIIGLLYSALIFCCPSHIIYLCAVAILMGFFSSYDGEIAKLLGAFIQSFLFTAVILYFGGAWLHRSLLTKPRQIPASPVVTTPEKPV